MRTCRKLLICCSSSRASNQGSQNCSCTMGWLHSAPSSGPLNLHAGQTKLPRAAEATQEELQLKPCPEAQKMEMK